MFFTLLEMLETDSSEAVRIQVSDVFQLCSRFLAFSWSRRAGTLSVCVYNFALQVIKTFSILGMNKRHVLKSLLMKVDPKGPLGRYGAELGIRE